MSFAASSRRPVALTPLAPLLLPVAVLLWAYWTTLVDLSHSWENPQYSHGYLVPLFVLFLLWARRDRLDTAAIRPGWLLGLPLLLVGIGMRLVGVYYFYGWLDPISLIPTLAGLWLLVGGWAAWRWAWPAVLFLSFMVPLPFRLASALSGPLQRLATIVSTFLMQTLGLPALSEGNVILLNEATIGVVEACSGLRMMMVFFALAVGMALLVQRPLLDRLILVASAAPIAVVVNILRITVTGILHDQVSSETANAFFHDVAGWLMMPAALGLLWVEMKVLAVLFIEAPVAPARVPRDTPRPRRRPAARPARQQQPSSPPAARHPAEGDQPQEPEPAPAGSGASSAAPEQG